MRKPKDPLPVTVVFWQTEHTFFLAQTVPLASSQGSFLKARTSAKTNTRGALRLLPVVQAIESQITSGRPFFRPSPPPSADEAARPDMAPGPARPGPTLPRLHRGQQPPPASSFPPSRPPPLGPAEATLPARLRLASASPCLRGAGVRGQPRRAPGNGARRRSALCRPRALRSLSEARAAPSP